MCCNLRFIQLCCCRFWSILDGTMCHWVGSSQHSVFQTACPQRLALWSYEMLRSNCPVTQCHIPRTGTLAMGCWQHEWMSSVCGSDTKNKLRCGLLLVSNCSVCIGLTAEKGLTAVGWQQHESVLCVCVGMTTENRFSCRFLLVLKCCVCGSDYSEQKQLYTADSTKHQFNDKWK